MAGFFNVKSIQYIVAFLAQHSGCISKHQNSGGRTTTTGFVPPRLHFTTQTTDKQPNTNDRVNDKRYITDLPAIKHFPVVSDLIVLRGGLEGCNYRIKTMISTFLSVAVVPDLNAVLVTICR